VISPRLGDDDLFSRLSSGASNFVHYRLRIDDPLDFSTHSKRSSPHLFLQPSTHRSFPAAIQTLWCSKELPLVGPRDCSASLLEQPEVPIEHGHGTRLKGVHMQVKATTVAIRSLPFLAIYHGKSPPFANLSTASSHSRGYLLHRLVLHIESYGIDATD